MALESLFKPGCIGSLQTKNRIVMAPMGTFSCEVDGELNDRTIDYYVARARGGAGLIIVQATPVTVGSHVPHQIGIYDDRFIPGLRRLASAIKDNGARAAIQLLHFGHQLGDPRRRQTRSTDELEVVSASEVRPLLYDVNPRKLTTQGIHDLVEAFAAATYRAKLAGFEAVEFHGAHGKLISQFLSPFYNRRTDEYGGSLENRLRFACEILQRSREAAGPDFPLTFRIDGYDGFEGGFTLQEAVASVPYLEQAGMNAVHVSAGADEGGHWQWITYLQPAGQLVPLAQAVKKVAGVPVIAVGKLGDPVLASQVVTDGKADFVALGRPLLADPDLPNKAREGRLDEINRCLYCSNCLTYRPKRGLRCTVNPALLREKQFQFEKVAAPKKVLVIGGGLAGMQAAVVAARRGHHVTLHEKETQLGGRWNIACRQEQKTDFAGLTNRLVREMKETGVKLDLGRTVTLELLKSEHPEAVVVATGSTNTGLNIPGAEGANVVQATDVILKKASVGSTVAVIGGRYIGMEISTSLARQGKRVYLATRGELGRGIHRSMILALREQMVESGVYLFTNSPAIAITAEGVVVIHEKTPLLLKAETVVLAVGAKSSRELADAIKPAFAEVYEVGDCLEARDAQAAMNEGAEAALKI